MSCFVFLSRVRICSFCINARVRKGRLFVCEIVFVNFVMLFICVIGFCAMGYFVLSVCVIVDSGASGWCFFINWRCLVIAWLIVVIILFVVLN